MKPFFYVMASAIALTFCAHLQAQTASVQIVHNCPDPAVATVDVYLNGALAADNVAFRTATDFKQVPAGVSVTVVIAPDTSTSAASALATFNNLSFAANQSYVVAATGVVNAANFTGLQPGSAFDLKIINPAQTSSTSGNVSFAVMHGAPDAPAVDVFANGGTPALVNNLAYPVATGYVTVPADVYAIGIAASADSNNVLATFKADLSALGGGAAVVFASGFLNPANVTANNGFGLFAALPSGGPLVAFPVLETADVQIVHNSPDPAAASVDIYLNGVRQLDNVAFRTATPFLKLFADFPYDIAVAPGTSTSAGAAVGTFNNVSFVANQKYVVAATGVLNPSGFTGLPTAAAFDLKIINPAQTSSTSGNVSFAVMHGAPDAPAVDVFANGGTPALVNNLAYPVATGYVTVPADVYAIGIAASADSNNVLATFKADLSALGGGAAVVFASGFLNPANATANNGFGLFAALPSGGPLVAFPVLETADVQIVHNSPDPAAASVDIYLNGVRQLDNVAFRTATPFLKLFADFPYDIAVAPGTSTSAGAAVGTFNNVSFVANQKYVVAATGVLNPSGFTGLPTAAAFDLKIINPAQTSSTSGNVSFAVMHGAPDAPAVDVFANGGTTALVNNLAYPVATGYVTVPAATYQLGIAASADSTTTLALFNADLSALGGGAAVVFASGFLNPANATANNGFGLFAALPSGGPLVAFPAITIGIDGEDAVTGLVVAPNPVTTVAEVRFSLAETAPVVVRLLTLAGQEVSRAELGTRTGEGSCLLDVQAVPAGIYLVSVEAGASRVVRRMVITR